MGKSKMHTLRKLVHHKRTPSPAEDDDLAMVGKSEVPVCLPPTHLLQSLERRQPASLPPGRPQLPPLRTASPPRQRASYVPYSPGGYRRSPAPEPIPEEGEEEVRRYESAESATSGSEEDVGRAGSEKAGSEVPARRSARGKEAAGTGLVESMPARATLYACVS